MKRRELIKSGLLLAGAVSVGMTGCKKDNEHVSNDNHSDFEDLKKIISDEAVPARQETPAAENARNTNGK